MNPIEYWLCWENEMDRVFSQLPAAGWYTSWSWGRWRAGRRLAVGRCPPWRWCCGAGGGARRHRAPCCWCCAARRRSSGASRCRASDATSTSSWVFVARHSLAARHSHTACTALSHRTHGTLTHHTHGTRLQHACATLTRRTHATHTPHALHSLGPQLDTRTSLDSLHAWHSLAEQSTNAGTADSTALV